MYYTLLYGTSSAPTSINTCCVNIFPRFTDITVNFPACEIHLPPPLPTPIVKINLRMGI